MAGTRKALLLLVAVCLTGLGLGPGVRGQAGVCNSMERCTTDFRDKARVPTHDKDLYCRLLKEKLQCYNTALGACPPDQVLYARRQIQSAQSEQKAACSAGRIRQTSHWLMALSAMLAVLFRRHL